MSLAVILFTSTTVYGQPQNSFTKQLLPVKKPNGKVSLLKLQVNSQAVYVKDLNEAGRFERFFTNTGLRPIEQRANEEFAKYLLREEVKKNEIAFSQFTTAVQNNATTYIFGVTVNGRIYYTVMTEDDRFSYWKELNTSGIFFRQITALENTGGTLQLFGLAEDGAVYFTKQSKPRDSAIKNWSGWNTLYGHNLKQVICEKSHSGAAIVFALSNDGSVYYIRQAEPLSFSWKNWESLGGTSLQKIDLEKNADGRLALFAISSDKSIYEIEQTNPEGGWKPWTTIPGKNVSDMTSELGNDGKISVFAQHPDGSVDVSRQLDPGGATWSNWVDLCPPKEHRKSPASALASSVEADGKMYIYQSYDWELFYATPWLPGSSSNGCKVLKIH